VTKLIDPPPGINLDCNHCNFLSDKEELTPVAMVTIVDGAMTWPVAMKTAVESIQACFHPNLAWTVKLEFKCGRQFRQFMATHDYYAYGGLSYEHRHFIDEHLWNLLREVCPELNELVRPHPPTSFVYNRKKKPIGRDADPFLPVKGMLKNPLKLSFIGLEALGLPSRFDHVVLTHVLVVENLPVPFHINSNADDIYKQLLLLDAKRPTEDIREELDWKDTGVQKESLKKETFPSRYHSHPFWVRNPDEHIQPLALDKTTYVKTQKVLLAAIEESLERGERDAAAVENGWEPIPHRLGKNVGQESWVHPGTWDRIDYYPSTDRCKTILKIHPKDAKDKKRCNLCYKKELVRDDVGGTAGLRKIFKHAKHFKIIVKVWESLNFS